MRLPAASAIQTLGFHDNKQPEVNMKYELFKNYTVFPHIVPWKLFFFEFRNSKVTVHKGAETIQGRKLFKGGNYMRK